jgi:hypothetical protein
MGTNYYLRKKKPTLHECVHVGKCSGGWKMHWQATDNGIGDWPRWCDEDPCVPELTLPHAINSVEDIRAYLITGDWELVDEYGDRHEDWEKKLSELEKWDGDVPNHNFTDAKGNVFDRQEYC